MKLLRLKYNLKGLSTSVAACHHSAHQKYVNEALGGETNFVNDFHKNHIETNNFQKLLLSFGSAFMSITDPRRGDMVAVMGESTGALAFEYMRKKMLQSDEGRQILEEKPRISSASVNLEELKEMAEGTLGKAYSNFLEKYKYTPDERLAVRFVDDVELAYVAQRYREVHDLFHTILDMPTNMLGEVTVKWVEAIQTRLPMCITGALFGPLRLAPKLTRTYSTAVAILDPEVTSGVKDKKFLAKNHPGKVKGGQIVIPEALEKSINLVLKRSNVCFDSQEIDAYKKAVYSKILPVEGLKKELLIASFKNKVLKKLSSQNQGLDEAYLNSIINEKMKNFEKNLMKVSEPIVFDKRTCLMYLKTRAPYEYATLLKILTEISKKDPMFKPKTLFDFGSGVGTVTWAASALWKQSIVEYFTVDASKEMNDLAYSIIHPVREKPFVQGFLQRQFLPANDINFDIVVAAFSFSYLMSYEDRMQKLNSLWNKTSKYLVVVENGTKNGFQVISEIREMILQQSLSLNFKCYVFAPCPHDLVCPRTTNSKRQPCNFLASYKELNEGNPENYRDTPYSYVVIRKEKRQDGKQWPRVLSEVLLRSRHLHCELCTGEGKIKKVVFSKSKCGKESYRLLKSLSWGDCLPGKVICNVGNTDNSEVKTENVESHGN